MSISSKQAKSGENPSGTEVGGGGGVGAGGDGGGSGNVRFGGWEDIFFFGEYQHGCDEKKRVQVPSKWRPREMPENANYEVNVCAWTRGAEEQTCLQIFPPGETMKLLQQVRQKSLGDEDAETLRRMLGGMSESVKYDKVGRICIPDRLARKAGIEKNSEVILVGLMDVYQVWNLERYAARQSKDGVKTPEALALLKNDGNKPK
jgi:division/cell wall cluster transcriptional repressor MraZ